WDNLTIDTSALVPANSSQVTTAVDNTPFIQQGFDCLTWGAVVFSTTVPQLEFVTKGSDGSLVPQSFTYNSIPCPVIDARVDASLDSRFNVRRAINGRVTDQASDLVFDPASQPTTLDIAVGAVLLDTLALSNVAAPVPPWRPYAYEAPFSTEIQLALPGFGEFPIALTTPPNVAGCGGSFGFTLFVGPGETDVVPDPAPSPG